MTGSGVAPELALQLRAEYPVGEGAKINQAKSFGNQPMCRDNTSVCHGGMREEEERREEGGREEKVRVRGPISVCMMQVPGFHSILLS